MNSAAFSDSVVRIIKTVIVPAEIGDLSDGHATYRQLAPRRLSRDHLLTMIVRQLHEDAIRQYWLEQERRPRLIAAIVNQIRWQARS